MNKLLFKFWLFLGTKLWRGISIYSPNDKVVALTFSNLEEYLLLLPEIEKLLNKP